MDFKWSPDPPRSGGPRWPSLIGLVGSYWIFFDSTIFGYVWIYLTIFCCFVGLILGIIILFATLGIFDIIYSMNNVLVVL